LAEVELKEKHEREEAFQKKMAEQTRKLAARAEKTRLRNAKEVWLKASLASPDNLRTRAQLLDIWQEQERSGNLHAWLEEQDADRKLAEVRTLCKHYTNTIRRLY
jgi:hypothetical protein